PGGRGAGGEGKTLQTRGFHVKLTPPTTPKNAIALFTNHHTQKSDRTFHSHVST
ncbi:hypothetical protein H6G35_35125, partial [Aulosira sp. FACHB-113]|nr:hypothetical protein [Aulosira sp. FACHB-113]